jgi:hypothetical protein
MSNTLLGKILLCEDLNDQETAIYHKFLEEKKRLEKLEKESKKKKK